MKYRITEGGGVVEGHTPAELVEALKGTGRFTEGQTNAQYMGEFAERYREFWPDVEPELPRTTSEKAFIIDLVTLGWLEPLE